MTFKVNRSLLKKALEAERKALTAAQESAATKYAREIEAYPPKLAAELTKIHAQVLKGHLPFNGESAWKGKIGLKVTAPPDKPKPDCRIQEIGELLRLLALSDDDTFNLNENSRYYQFACRISR